MSISFEKHRAQIIAAWKDVLDDKSSTNWSLFDYEPHSNELKVVGSGEEGIDELCENLNSGKIMYAFVRIEDTTTGLQKFLLVNWQGEGAPVLRKGTCAKHIYDVAKLLSGAHLTINARNEDDIDMERLLKKLSTVSSAYSFKQPRTAMEEQKTPVGTNYTRVIPTKELNASIMQDFWKKEEAEEKRRIAAEKETKRLQLQKQEQEQRTREEKEHRAREQIVVSANKLQSAHVPIKTTPHPLSPDKSAGNLSSGLTEAERMRQMRNQEARELIGSRVGAAKAIFTQNTSEGQLQTKLNTAPPAKPARNSIAQRINAFNQPQQQEQPHHIQQQQQPRNLIPKETVVLPESAHDDDELPLTIPPPSDFAETIPLAPVVAVTIADIVNLPEPVKPEMTANANQDDLQQTSDDFAHEQLQQQEMEQYSTIKRSPHTKTNSLQSPDELSSSSNATDTAVYQDQDDEQETDEVRTKVSVTVQQAQSAKNGVLSSGERNKAVTDLDFICQDTLGDLGLQARALYDYEAADDSEITFDPGDIITHIDQIDEGWWQGLGPDGTYGLFPANYVEIFNLN